MIDITISRFKHGVKLLLEICGRAIQGSRGSRGQVPLTHLKRSRGSTEPVPATPGVNGTCPRDPCYKQIIDKAHALGIKVIGGTVMPFKGNGYYSPNHEEGRKKLNAWILSYEGFDGVIDHAANTASADDPERMNEAYLFENDWLHPNASGHNRMGSTVDLNLFRE